MDREYKHIYTYKKTQMSKLVIKNFENLFLESGVVGEKRNIDQVLQKNVTVSFLDWRDKEEFHIHTSTSYWDLINTIEENIGIEYITRIDSGDKTKKQFAIQNFYLKIKAKVGDGFFRRIYEYNFENILQKYDKLDVTLVEYTLNKEQIPSQEQCEEVCEAMQKLQYLNTEDTLKSEWYKTLKYYLDRGYCANLCICDGYEGYLLHIMNWSYRCNYETLKLLIKYGADVNFNIPRETIENNEERINSLVLLIENGLDCRYTDEDGNNVYYNIGFFQSFEDADLFISTLEKCNFKMINDTREGQTVFLSECERGDVYLLKAMIKHGANVEQSTDSDNALSLFSVEYRDDDERWEKTKKEVVVYLINKGLDLNIAPTEKKYSDRPAGETILAYCVNHFVDVNVIEHLLECGADPHFKNQFGQTAYEFCCARGAEKNHKMMVYLKKAMQPKQPNPIK